MTFNQASYLSFPGGSNSKESACNTRDPDFIPGPERSPGVGNGYPLQYSSLENSMDREAWWDPWGCKKLDTTELLSAHTYTFQLEFLLV